MGPLPADRGGVRVVLAPDQAGADGVLGPGEVGVVEGMQSR